jgi:hypothetical protein
LDNEQNIIIPHIEDNIPLPTGATDAFPELSPKEELDARARTITLLAELNGNPLKPTAENVEQAKELATQMVNDPKFRPEYKNYPNETLAYLAGMVTQMNVALVDDLAELKMYVVNKLVYEVEHANDAKSRLTALKALGEVDGVDAFKKRSEVTMKVQSMEEVEKELLSTLSSLKHKAIDVEAKEIKPKND